MLRSGHIVPSTLPHCPLLPVESTVPAHCALPAPFRREETGEDRAEAFARLLTSGSSSLPAWTLPLGDETRAARLATSQPQPPTAPPTQAGVAEGGEGEGRAEGVEGPPPHHHGGVLTRALARADAVAAPRVEPHQIPHHPIAPSGAVQSDSGTPPRASGLLSLLIARVTPSSSASASAPGATVRLGRATDARAAGARGAGRVHLPLLHPPPTFPPPTPHLPLPS